MGAQVNLQGQISSQNEMSQFCPLVLWVYFKHQHPEIQEQYTERIIQEFFFLISYNDGSKTFIYESIVYLMKK